MTTTTKPAVAPPAAAAKPAVRRDWTWRHGPVVGPFNGGSGAIALAMIGDIAATPGWVGVAAAAAGGAGIWIRSVHRRVSPLGISYRVACMAGAGGWMSWALATSAWSPTVLGLGVAGVVAAGLAAPEMSDHEARVRSREHLALVDAATAQTESVAAAERIEIAEDWEARLTRIIRAMDWKDAVTNFGEWPGRTGYTIEVRLPSGGIGWLDLHKSSGRFASDLALPHGCGVEVTAGKDKGHALIKVALVDTTAEPVPYPADYSPLTLAGPIPVGMHRGAVPAELDLIEDPVILAGRRGSGKTVFMQVINLGLARCPDVLLWHIDLNGAGMSRPWLDPWLNGEASRPAVDWVAPTVDEAVLMLRTAITMMKGRKSAYQALMRQVDDDKLPISAQLPAIMIALDEGAEAVASGRGHRVLGELLDEYVSIVRAMRGNLIMSVLRATADICPPFLQSQAGVKAYLRPEEPHEVAQLLGWVAGNGVGLDDATWPGSGLMRKPGMPIMNFRGHLLKPSQIRDAAIACAHLRPDLDKPSADLGGDAYANRWDRYRAWTDNQGGTTVTVPNTPEPQRPTGIAGLAGAASDLDAAMERMREVREKHERDRAAARPADEIDAAFADIVAGEDWNGDAGSTAGPVQMLRLLGAAGADGMRVEALHAQLRELGVNPSQATLYRWLNAAEGVRAEGGRWYLTP